MAMAKRAGRTAPAAAQPSAAAPTGRSFIGPGGRWLSWLAPIIMIALLLVIWEVVVRAGQYPSFLLPTPEEVFQRWRDAVADGTIPSNAATTLEEAGIGFLLAALVALPGGYVLAHVALLERFFAPLIAASQAVPAVAVAPLLVVWLGNGATPKVLVCAVVVFFPLLVGAVTGLRGVPHEYLEVA